MRVPLEKLMEKLGVDRTLSPYETQPWFHYEDERGITCSAEVRMGPGGDDVEAEIQFLYDDGAGQPPPNEAGSGDGNAGTQGGPQQIMRMRAVPVSSGEWSPTDLKVKGESFVNKIYNWEEKGCDFFRACIQSIQMGDLPNVDELVAQELSDDGGGGGGKSGRIGRKSPKIKPAQLLGVKKGM